MALLTCPDCGGQLSDAAPSCPTCGRPNDAPEAIAARAAADPGVCPHCGATGVKTDSGLHGFAEVTVAILLTLFMIIPGLIFFAVYNRQRWCPNCKRRP